VHYPPGPPSRGLIGNFPMGSKDPLALFTQWAREFGDIFHYRALHRHVYFLNHPDLIKEVLLTHHQNFIKGEAVRFNRQVFGNGLIANEGPSWVKQRRLIQPAFHRERIASYAAVMAGCAERMAASWRDGETRNIHEDMMRLTLQIVATTLFNVEIGPEQDKIATALNDLMELSSGARMLLPPLLRAVPTPGNLRYRRAVAQLHAVVEGLIRQRRAHPLPNPTDLLSTLLQTRDETGAAMPDRQVRDEVMTLLLAGHETTAVSLSWTWLLLAQNPDAESQLHAELRHVLNGRSPQLEDLPQLVYTERIVKESMRLYPPVWALVRNPIHEIELAGYRISPNAAIMMSPRIMHRDPRFYSDPERFHPGRWLDGPSNPLPDPLPNQLPKFAYFPFGGGPRACIGASFATMEATLVLATLAQRYRLRIAAHLPVEPVPSITLRPRHGIQATLIRRTN
jgi:cytochrome P450